MEHQGVRRGLAGKLQPVQCHASGGVDPRELVLEGYMRGLGRYGGGPHARMLHKL